jgi:hypothetical protein
VARPEGDSQMTELRLDGRIDLLEAPCQAR